MNVTIIRIDLPLKHVMTVFRSTISSIRTVVVELEQDGLKGYGEAYEDAHWGVTIDGVVDSLRKCGAELKRYALADPYAFEKRIGEIIKDNPAAACAIEMAACDLWGKLQNKPLWRLWGYDATRAPISSYTLGLDSLYRMLEKFEEQKDWPLYRVKMGSREDMVILHNLREKTKAPFRLDVNGGWSINQAMKYLPDLEKLDVELIEQPFHPDDVEAMKAFREVCKIPLIADESCRSIEDLEKCVEYFDGVNLKPIKFGGLNPTRRAVKRAKELGLKTMMGNTIESSVGASATSQFAPTLDYVYLDGPMLIDKKYGNGVKLDCGRIVWPRESGIGVTFSRASASRRQDGD